MFVGQLVIHLKLARAFDLAGSWILQPKISKTVKTYWLLRPSHQCSFELFLHLSVGILGAKGEESWLYQQQSISIELLCCVGQLIDSVHDQPVLCRQFGWHLDLGCSHSSHFILKSRAPLDHPIQWLVAFFFQAKVLCNLLEFIWTIHQGSS